MNIFHQHQVSKSQTSFYSLSLRRFPDESWLEIFLLICKSFWWYQHLLSTQILWHILNHLSYEIVVWVWDQKSKMFLINPFCFELLNTSMFCVQFLLHVLTLTWLWSFAQIIFKTWYCWFLDCSSVWWLLIS